MNSFILKIIACVTMFIDHLIYKFPNQAIILPYVGRIALPIFAFQSVQGYAHSKDIKKYLLRILIFALISQVPYQLYFNVTELNVLFTLFLGLVCIYCWDNLIKNNKVLALTIIICIMFLSEIIHTDYSYYGIAIMLIFHIFKNKKILMTLGFIISTIIFFVIKFYNFYLNERIAYFIIFTLLGIIPCLLYNEKQGPKVKYLFYLFYPLHLLFLLLLSFVL